MRGYCNIHSDTDVSNDVMVECTSTNNLNVTNYDSPKQTLTLCLN